jgi:hypothetical protein
MTSQEFVVWLKGFTEACNDLTATPKQWDRIKEVLEKVSDKKESVPIGPSGIITTGGTTSVSSYPLGANINYTQLID